MIWIAPPEKATTNSTREKRLWDAADQFRANSGLKAQEYSGPILGLIFLRFAKVRFALHRARLEKDGTSSRRGSQLDDPNAYHADGILFLTSEARLDHPLNRPEGADIGAKVNDAMRHIEKHNPQVAGGLSVTFNVFTGSIRKDLLKKVSEIPATTDSDALGRIYEPSGARQSATSSPKGEHEWRINTSRENTPPSSFRNIRKARPKNSPSTAWSRPTRLVETSA